MAGYSGTPLPKKLGIKPGHRVALLGAPKGFRATLGQLPENVTLHSSLRGTQPFDVIVFFTIKRAELKREFDPVSRRLTIAGGLWIGWPKKSSGVGTDVSEADVREIGLACGLVDNKICAIDETWSGLRFVRRLKDRG